MSIAVDSPMRRRLGKHMEVPSAVSYDVESEERNGETVMLRLTFGAAHLLSVRAPELPSRDERRLAVELIRGYLWDMADVHSQQRRGRAAGGLPRYLGPLYSHIAQHAANVAEDALAGRVELETGHRWD